MESASITGQEASPPRVHFYVDGVNLYHGMSAKGWARYQWLDVQRLCEGFLKPWQEMRCVKYFTSRIGDPSSDASGAHDDYLEALSTACRKTMIFFGNPRRPRNCGSCGSDIPWRLSTRTDVNIAASMLGDALMDKCDVLCLVSGDSDLVPVVNTIRAFRKDKKIVGLFPPGRVSNHLRAVSHATLVIGRSRLAGAQLPDEFRLRNGHVVRRPGVWT